jgi:hypothetical protein
MMHDHDLLGSVEIARATLVDYFKSFRLKDSLAVLVHHDTPRDSFIPFGNRDLNNVRAC